MGGLFGIGGSSTKTDRANVTDSEGDLRSVFNYGLPTGEAGQAKGNSTLDTAMSSIGMAGDYWKRILSGGRSANLEAAAPVTNAVNAEGDALKTQEAQLGTGRGGGTNATIQNLDTQKMATVDNAIGSQRGKSAAGEAQVGAEEGAIGGTELNNALNLLGLSSNAAGNIGNLGLGAQKQDFKQQQATGAAIGQLLLAGLAI